MISIAFGLRLRILQNIWKLILKKRVSNYINFLLY
jgi:hypothetical protein